MFYANRVPAAIRGLLGDPAVRCVGEDAAKLSDDYGPRVRRSGDLEGRCNEYLGIGGLGRRRLGLKGYAREVLGMTMEKPWHVTMSNGRGDSFEVAQVQYACIDAYVSYKLGERLLDN
ncbi:Werner Syndrome-like exonuclease [Hordeum vulgare]|nr:Werner Syndrome-like exonuclease [Hordeum vulgare]